MNKSKVPHLVYWVALTTITAIFWAGFSTYRALTHKPSPSVPPEILEPLTPSLPNDVLNKVQKGVFFEESQIVEVSTPRPSATATPIPTSSATPTTSPSTSPSP